MGLIMPGTQHEKAGNPFLIANFFCFLSRYVFWEFSHPFSSLFSDSPKGGCFRPWGYYGGKLLDVQAKMGNVKIG